MKRLFLVLLLMLAFSAAAQVSEKQLVANAFPSYLDDGDGIRFSRFLRMDLNGDGHPLIVAAYTNGARGALRVLDDGGQVVAEAAPRGMSGFRGSVRAVDLDADGAPEIVAQFDSGHGLDLYDSWIFKWMRQTRTLSLLSPTCQGGTVAFTCFNSVDFVDWNGDGRLAVVNYPDFKVDDNDDVEPAGPWTLYVLANGQYQQQPNSFVYKGRFSRGTAGPLNASDDFDCSAGKVILRVVNGTGGQATDSGHVILNGKEILGPGDFKRQDHLYSVPVQAQEHNILTVRLDGKPGANIQVFVDQAQVTP